MLHQPSTEISESSPRLRAMASRTGAVLLLLLVLLGGNYKLVTGSAAPQWDAADFFSPAFSLVADHVKAGQLMLWNPWVAAGSPDFAEPELGATSPILLTVAYLFPTVQSGFVAYWLLIWIGGGLGMLALARSFGAPFWGATLVALGYATSGFYCGHAEHTSSLYSICFIPWILWRLDHALKTNRLWPAAQAGALYGLSTLGGYPEFTILTGLLLALWSIGRLLYSQRNEADTEAIEARAPKAFLYLALVVLMGAAICSPIYTAFRTATAGYSDRVGTRGRSESLSSNLLPVGALATFASPYLVNLQFPPRAVWPRTDVSMSSIYMGSGILLFGAFSLTRATRWRWWICLLALFFGACAMGDQLPVRGWLYDLVTPTRYFRNPALFREYVIVLLSVLAALGVSDMSSPLSRERRGIFSALSFVLALAAIVSFGAVVTSTDMRPQNYSFAVWHLLLVWVGSFLLATFVERAETGRPALLYLFTALAVFDAFSTLQIARPMLYTEATLPWWHAQNSRHNGNLQLSGELSSRALVTPFWLGNYPNNRNVPFKKPLLSSYVTLKNRYYDQLLADKQLRSAALGSDRFWFTTHPIWAAPNDPSFAEWASRVHAFGMPVLLLHSREQMLGVSHTYKSDTAVLAPPKAPPEGGLCEPARVMIRSYSPDELSLDYVAAQDGWLLVTDRWAPDWHVSVNKVPATLLGANFVFRAVYVKRGPNHVQFRYQPWPFWPLLALSWSVLLVIFAGDCARLWTRVRARATPARALLHSI